MQRNLPNTPQQQNPAMSSTVMVYPPLSSGMINFSGNKHEGGLPSTAQPQMPAYAMDPNTMQMMMMHGQQMMWPPNMMMHPGAQMQQGATQWPARDLVDPSAVEVNNAKTGQPMQQAQLRGPQQPMMFMPYQGNPGIPGIPGMQYYMPGKDAPVFMGGATEKTAASGNHEGDDKKQDESSNQNSKTESTEEVQQIKRPANSFLTFASEWRPKLQAEHRNAPNALISKYLGDKWKSMSKAEKAVYILQSEEVRKEFHKQHPDFVYSRSNKKKKKSKSTSDSAVKQTIKK